MYFKNVAKKAALTGLAAISIGIAGCASIPEAKKTQPIIPLERQAPESNEQLSPITIRSYNVSGESVTRDISFAGAPLHAVLRAALPGHNITPQDENVDLSMPINMRADSMAVPRFFEQLEAMTNLDFKRERGEIKVASMVSMQWRLPAFASNQTSSADVAGSGGAGVTADSGQSGFDDQGGSSSGGGSGGGTERGGRQRFERENNEWEAMIETAEAYAESVVGIRSQGLVRAMGKPRAMKQLDEFMRSARDSSETLISLDVSTFEVTLTDRRARGIDWEAIFDGMFSTTSGGFTVDAGVNLPVNLAGDTSGGASLGIRANPSDTPIDVMFDLLSEFGTVMVDNQPQVSTLNGKTAFIASGREFGFISEIRSTVNANIATVEPTFQRLLVGVELSITPTLMDDGRVMMEVVPIVSTFEGFDNFDINGNSASQPRIALQQLSTTTVATPGQPIQIGGLIQSRMVDSINSLPLGQKESLGIAGLLLESQSQELERSELVIMITPELVGA